MQMMIAKQIHKSVVYTDPLRPAYLSHNHNKTEFARESEKNKSQRISQPAELNENAAEMVVKPNITAFKNISGKIR